MNWTTVVLQVLIVTFFAGPNNNSRCHALEQERVEGEQNGHVCISDEGSVCSKNQVIENLTLDEAHIMNDEYNIEMVKKDQEQDKEVKDSIEARRQQTEKCKDDDERCDYWSSAGECKSNPAYMLQSCKRSCKVCSIREERLSSG